jgi:hypothetical protein
MGVCQLAKGGGQISDVSTYIEMRRKAIILDNKGDYNLAESQMNPAIFDEFIRSLRRESLPTVVWEPFANSVSRSRLLESAVDAGAVLISQSINPKDSRILSADSTVTGPGVQIGGILFHPPYYGSAPISNDRRDVALSVSSGTYLKRLGCVIDQAEPWMVHNGMACVIARDYRIHGERIRLDLWMLELFESKGYCLIDVWGSEPDVVLILTGAPKKQ